MNSPSRRKKIRNSEIRSKRTARVVSRFVLRISCGELFSMRFALL